MKHDLFDLEETLIHEQQGKWREASPLLKAVLAESYSRLGDRMATPSEFEMLQDDPGYAIEVLVGMDEKTDWYAFGWAMGAGLFPPERVAELIVRRAMERIDSDEGYYLLRKILVHWGLMKDYNPGEETMQFVLDDMAQLGGRE
jgi:hypothetical protein